MKQIAGRTTKISQIQIETKASQLLITNQTKYHLVSHNPCLWYVIRMFLAIFYPPNISKISEITSGYSNPSNFQGIRNM
jgi:hypothetical protein